MRLIEIASSQYSVFTFHQALEVGFTASAVKRRVDRGVWIRLHRAVFVPATVAIGWEQRTMAAIFACGPDAVASHGSAALIRGIGSNDGYPYVTVPSTRFRAHLGVVVRRTGSFEMRRRHSFPVTPPMRTLLDLGHVYAEARLEHALDAANRGGLILLTRLDAYLTQADHRSRPGSGFLREMVRMRLGSRPIGSDLETDLFRLLRRFKLALPIPQFRVETAHGVRYLDFAYPDQMVAIEINGFEEHAGKRAKFDDDHIRRNDLADLGWKQREFTYPQIKSGDPSVAETIRCALDASSTREGVLS
ncbi:MAG: type IV toxin-antitoxin system AbiEi family antitoxin domain-containing protein [Actinomycetota bacterium]